MEKYTICRAGLQDVNDLKRVEVECGLSPWTIAAYESELALPEGVILAARTADHETVGFLAGRISLIEGGVAEINNIGTLLRYRRDNVGSMLLETFRDMCSQSGASAIWLEVRSKNRAAIDFYGSHGFVFNGTRPNFYSDPTEDAKLMSLALI